MASLTSCLPMSCDNCESISGRSVSYWFLPCQKGACWHFCRHFIPNYPASLARSSSACRANLPGLDFLSLARFCSFHFMAGNCDRWRHFINVQSGSPETRPNKNRRWSGVNAAGSSDFSLRRTRCNSASVTGFRAMPANSFSKADDISASRENKTS